MTRRSARPVERRKRAGWSVRGPVRLALLGVVRDEQHALMSESEASKLTEVAPCCCRVILFCAAAVVILLDARAQLASTVTSHCGVLKHERNDSGRQDGKAVAYLLVQPSEEARKGHGKCRSAIGQRELQRFSRWTGVQTSRDDEPALRPWAEAAWWRRSIAVECEAVRHFTHTFFMRL